MPIIVESFKEDNDAYS